MEPPSPSRHALVVYAVALATFAATLRFGFVYDDAWTIVDNGFIRDWHNLSRLFGARWFQSLPDNDRPLMVLSTMVDYAINRLRPGGYHLQSVLWHALASVLVLRLARRLLASDGEALLAALLFAVHPLHVEAVAAINYREDPMATALLLAALLAFAHAREGGGARAFVGGCVAALVAPFAKESALVLPLLLVATDRRLWRAAVVVTLLYAVAWVPFYRAFPHYTSEDAAALAPLATRLWTSAGVFADYLVQLLVPVGLSAEYGTVVRGAADARNVSAAIALALLGYAAWRQRRRAPIFAWATAWFFVALLPVAGVAPLFNVRADRYVYLPSVGWCIGAAWAAGRVPAAWRVRARAFAVALLVVFGVAAIARSFVWRSELTLWQATVASSPGAARAWQGLAIAQALGGRPGDALATADAALARFGADAKLYLARGIAHSELGAQADAVADLELAVRLARGEDRARAWNDLSVVFLRAGRRDDAERAARRAVALAPESDRFRQQLGETQR